MQLFNIDQNYQNYLNLLRAVVISQFKRREQGSLLGLSWSILNPLLMLTIIYVVFNNRMGVDVEHYAVYLLIGIVMYTHFANSTIAAMQVFAGLSALTANAIFPKEILVIATVLSRSIEFAVAFIVCIGIAALAGVELSITVLWVPLVIVLQTVFALSISLLLSCFYLYLRDIEHIYQVLLRLLFFMMPIFYTIDFLGDGAVRSLVMMNPLTHLMMFARSAILGGDSIAMPLAISVLLAIPMILIALRIFRKFEPFIAERV